MLAGLDALEAAGAGGFASLEDWVRLEAAELEDCWVEDDCWGEVWLPSSSFWWLIYFLNTDTVFIGGLSFF